jgi:hypothetical protein
MHTKFLTNISGKILVVGPIWGNMEKLDKIKSLANKYDYIIINGNAIQNGSFENYLFMNNFFSLIKNSIYNMGDIELKLLYIKDMDLLQNKSNIVSITFSNGYKVLITNGGFNNQMKDSNIESSFINYNWHEDYNGKLGYIISNNPILESSPNFYRHSARIGNVHTSSEVYAQEIDKFGLKQTIVL